MSTLTYRPGSPSRWPEGSRKNFAAGGCGDGDDEERSDETVEVEEHSEEESAVGLFRVGGKEGARRVESDGGPGGEALSRAAPQARGEHGGAAHGALRLG